MATVNGILIQHNARRIAENHWVIADKEKGWSLEVVFNAVYPETGNVFAWKIDSQYFDKENWAAEYLTKIILEKNTGVRIIYGKQHHVPDICGIGGAACRHPNACNTALCLQCPVAEKFFAKKDNVVLKYVDEEQ